MAVHFETTPSTLTIEQTRRGLRIVIWLYVVFGALGAVIINRPGQGHVDVTCHRAEGRCTVKHARSRPSDLDLASIAGVRLADAELLLDRTNAPAYHLCRAPRAQLVGAAEQIAAFLHDPAAPALTTACDSTINVGVPVAGRIAGIAGMLAILLVLGWYLVETHVVIDRAAGTIVMRGSRWPRRRWSIERPLRAVTGVWVRKLYVGRGQRTPLIYVRFDDDTSVLAYSPAAFRPAKLDEQVAELRRAVTAPTP